MKILKTAVVGLGRIGWRTHIPKIVERPERFSLVGVVDLIGERLDEAKDKYCVNGYTDIATMIEAEHPDLVVIASPTHLHRDHACTALKLGCDVFLDKPMATTYEEALEIVECARENGRKLMVYQPRRTDAAPNQLMAIIASGKIGKLCSYGRSDCSYIRRADWQAFKKFGGGMINNYGSHLIDAALYMTGEKVVRLHCITNTVASVGDAEDVVKILIKTENGVMVNIDINQAAGLPTPEWIIYGSTGAIISEVAPNKKHQFRLRYFDPTTIPAITASDALAAATRSYNNDVPLPWVEEIVPLDKRYAVDFYEKVYEYYAEDKPPYVPVEQTLYVMELLDRCHKDADK